MVFYGAEYPPRNPPDLPAGKSAPYAPLRTGFPSPRLGYTTILCRPGCNYGISTLPISLRRRSLPFPTLSSLLSMYRRRNSIRCIYLVADPSGVLGLKPPTVSGIYKRKKL